MACSYAKRIIAVRDKRQKEEEEMYLKNLLCACAIFSMSFSGYAADQPSNMAVVQQATETSQVAPPATSADEEALAKARFWITENGIRYGALMSGHYNSVARTVLVRVSSGDVSAPFLETQGLEVTTPEDKNPGFDNVVIQYQGVTAKPEETPAVSFCAKKPGAEELEGFEPLITEQCSAERLAVAEKLLTLAKGRGLEIIEKSFIAK